MLVRNQVKRLLRIALRCRANLRLRSLRKRVWGRCGTIERCFGYTVHIADGPNFYMQYKDDYVRRIYHFDAIRPDPLIIDGGSNIGMSILYFKSVYPAARVIGFEPDPNIFGLLQENMARNGIDGVTLVNAALSTGCGNALFEPDGGAGGRLGKEGEGGVSIRTAVLSGCLDDEVDFLKLNIEGAELSVLEEAAAGDRLRRVREIVVEYHGWPAAKQQLGTILSLLDQQGFRYLVHDFDAESCGTSKPPFRLTPQTTWFCLVYARRMGD